MTRQELEILQALGKARRDSSGVHRLAGWYLSQTIMGGQSGPSLERLGRLLEDIEARGLIRANFHMGRLSTVELTPAGERELQKILGKKEKRP